MITYKPMVEETKEQVDTTKLLLEKIQKIEEKLDSLVKKPEVEKRKEINIDAY